MISHFTARCYQTNTLSICDARKPIETKKIGQSCDVIFRSTFTSALHKGQTLLLDFTKEEQCQDFGGHLA